ncbi:MAG TPA: ThuA domain-containing protein [Saprospiraceae bacterium]|nr:ThuA domain-containing protein [Saprospiraceae bacterium]
MQKNIANLFAFIMSIIFLLLISCADSRTDQTPVKDKLNVLLFSKTNAFRHESIEPGGAAIKSYFESRDISITHTEDSTIFNSNNLAAFDVVVFLNTTGNILDSIQQESLVNHVKSGKGFVGIHSASDTEYDWPWYAGLLGAQFASHSDIQQAAVMKVDTHHIACKHLPDRWTRTDEWYNFRQLPSNVNYLLTVDEATYQGGTQGNLHPVSWYHEYDGGRSFYTAMGHTVESYQDTMFLEHILQGVIWAGGR